MSLWCLLIVAGLAVGGMLILVLAAAG